MVGTTVNQKYAVPIGVTMHGIDYHSSRAQSDDQMPSLPVRTIPAIADALYCRIPGAVQAAPAHDQE